VPRPRGKLRRLGLKTDAGGLVQKFGELRLIEFAQRRGTFAAQLFRKGGGGFAFKPLAQFAERRVERIVYQQSQGTFIWCRAGGRRSGFPNDVQDDVFEIRIAVVAVRVPAVAAQINFHVTGARRFTANLDDGAAKIRPAFGADETGMQHADSFPIRSFQLVAPQPLMPPDGLEQTLGGKAVFVAQNVRGTALFAPDGVKIFGGRIHQELLLLQPGDEVNLF
jgi:hypothetical protein